MKRFLPWMILLLSVAGIIISSYLYTTDFSKDSFCNIDEVLSCSTVANSEYARFFGISVALMGILWYSIMATLALGNRAMTLVKKGYSYPLWRSLFSYNVMFNLSVVGCLFSLYLTAMEIFMIRTFCALCLVSQGIVVIILFLSFWEKD